MSTRAQFSSDGKGRLDFVDVLRGVAVILMIFYHTAEGWIQTGLRTGGTWGWICSAGGLAAPLFLLLAGASLGLKSAAQIRGGQSTWQRTRTNLARGLQLVILGYLLRLQMWIIDAGGSSGLGAWMGALLLITAYAMAFLGLIRLKSNQLVSAATYVLIAAMFFALGLFQVYQVAPGRVTRLLRVDVLQAIGASLALVSLVGGFTRMFDERPYLAVIFGACVAGATPIMRQLVPGPLPQPLAAYLAWWDAGREQPVIALFPLFPWMAYTFVGTALGVYWDRAARSGRVERTVIAFSVLGAVIALLSNESWISPLFGLWPFLVQPFRVAYRVGIALALSGAALALVRCPVKNWLPAPLRYLGSASLLVYWLHLEFAYGLAAHRIAHSLRWDGWLVGFALLTAAMTIAAWLRINAPALWNNAEISAITTIRRQGSS